MNTQPQPHSHKESDRPLLAIISVLLSSLGGLMLVLILGLSLFGSTIFYHLMCFLAGRVDEHGTTLILLIPIYLPLLLALIFAFIARRFSGTSRVVEVSRKLALGLFVLALVPLPYLLFLTTACYG
ncbi:MAG: hypothetical protein NVSMB27_21410 [Ktedonobacteraceae bacterium]